jgi:Protein of unknown function (DUF2806)
MSDSNSIINLGELAKPATVLVEKISEAIGGLARPWQIKRVAEAEAEADRIQAVSQIKITELQRRAMTRLIAEEARKQNNIESITAKALPQLESGAKPENVEDDWIANFFDECRLISDEEMQRLWAKVLAGEANSPGKFSKRTVDLLGSLDKSDAALFTQLCSFNFDLGALSPLIYDSENKIYTDRGINFSSLSHLESMGLIHFTQFGYKRRGFRPMGFAPYFGTNVFIQFPNQNHCELNIGKVMLTVPGQQLALVCGAQAVEGFVEYVREQWRTFGYKTEPEPEQTLATGEPSPSAPA